MVGSEKLLMPTFPIQFLQLYCEKARIKDAAFDQLKTSLDVGDFVGAKGTIKRTEKGR
jgi:lysyl-tRNA synthetase class 2